MLRVLYGTVQSNRGIVSSIINNFYCGILKVLGHTGGSNGELEGLVAGVARASENVNLLASSGRAGVELLRALVRDLADMGLSSVNLPAESGDGGVGSSSGNNQLTVGSNDDLTRRGTVGDSVEVLASELDLERRNGGVSTLQTKDDLVTAELKGLQSHGASAGVDTKGVLRRELARSRRRRSSESCGGCCESCERLEEHCESGGGERSG